MRTKPLGSTWCTKRRSNSIAVSHHGPDGELPVFEKEDLVAPKVVGADLGEMLANVVAEGLDDRGVALNGRCGVRAAHELLVQPLQQFGHRHLPL
jgi:hypothetical protein